MADQLKQFMMGLGFQLDTAGMAKLEAFVKNTENYAKQSAANIDKLVKTLEGYTKGLTRTTSEAAKQKQTQEQQTKAAKDFCKQLEECLEGIKKNVNALGDHREEQDKNTKSTEEGTKSLRRHGTAHHAMRETWKISKEAVLGFVGALSALAITGEESVRRVSKSFESLFYLSQRSGVAGHAIEALRFQFRSVGLDAELADQAIGSMADHIADMPATLSVISGRIGKTVTNAGEAVTGLAERYAELLRTGSPSEIAAFRDFLRLMGQNENVIAQLGRNIGAANTALELHHKILHDLGFGDGKTVSELLQKRSVEFRKSWVGTQEVLGRVAESFAGALMPGLTRFLRAALGGLPDINDGFKQLCESFDGFIENLIGPKGEKLQAWMKDVSDGFKRMSTTENLEKLNTVLGGTAKIIGAIASSIELIAKYPEIAGALLGAAAGARVAGVPGAAVGAVLGLTTASTLSGSERDEKWNKELLDWQRNKSLGREERSFQQMRDEFDKKYPKEAPKPEPTGHQRGGIVGINAHVGEAVLPVSLTNMLLRAANQPQSFSTRGGLGSLTDILDGLSNDFNQWWSGSASFNPIVQLANDVYEKLSAMLHQLLEDFGFEQKAVGGPGGGGGGGAEAGSGGGSVRPGGRFAGMGPGGGKPGEAANVDESKGNFRNQAIDYFVSQGWTREQAAGIAANLEHESQWNKGARGDSGKAFGLGQWHPDRQAKFKETYGKDIREATFGEQLAFVNWELNNTEKVAGDRLRRATTAREAGGAVSQYYERPSDVHGNVARRGALAESIHTGYSPSGAGGIPESGGGRVKELQGRMAAIRKLPLAARLKAQLEYASEQAQVIAEVFSGGQAESGSHRTGSHRHDRGEAGDVQLRDPKTGQLLDMRNPADQARMAQFVTSATASGVTGVGGAEGYMGAHGLHLGGGASGTWGASGKFGTAPKWLQDAYNKGVAMRGKLGTENRQMQRNLGTDKPAWRESSLGGNGADYGGGGDLPRTQEVVKHEMAVTVVGAAHGTGTTTWDMSSRKSPIRKRNRENSLV